MRVLLLRMYSTYEREFDGPCMLAIVPPFVKALQDLVATVKEIEIEPLHVPTKVDRSDSNPRAGRETHGRKKKPASLISNKQCSRATCRP